MLSSALLMIAAGNRRIKEVMIEKKAHRPSGLILSKKPYVTDKAKVIGVRISNTLCTVLRTS